MQVSILTGGCVGRFQAGADGLPPLGGDGGGGPGGLDAPCGCSTWLTEYDLKPRTRQQTLKYFNYYISIIVH